MYHLLPPENKKEIRREYGMRRLIVGISLLAAAAGLFFASLIPAYLLARSREDAARSDLASVSAKNDSASEKKLQDEIQAANAQVALLAGGGRGTPFDALHAAIIQKPADIHLNGFFFSPGSAGQAHITGIADTRESLLRYVDLLRGQAVFSSVDLPISSFATSRNIGFTIALTGSF